MARNTRKVSDEILAAAVKTILTFGLERLDSLPKSARQGLFVEFKHTIAKQIGCHPESAKRKLDKAYKELPRS